jgi:hypothetical protein
MAGGWPHNCMPHEFLSSAIVVKEFVKACVNHVFRCIRQVADAFSFDECTLHAYEGVLRSLSLFPRPPSGGVSGDKSVVAFLNTPP